MNKFVRLLWLMLLLVALVLAITACEKDRPVPQPAGAGTGTPVTATGQATLPPLLTLPTSQTPGVTGASPNSTAAAGTPQPPATSGAGAQGSAGAASSGTYTVVAGDTLMSIAKRFGTTTQELQKLNNITNPDLIAPGQVLKLPQPTAGEATSSTAANATVAPVGAGGTTYTVQRGDTLSGIASRFGTTTRELMAINNIANANQIYVGQTIKLPTGGSAGSSTGAPAGVPARAATGEPTVAASEAAATPSAGGRTYTVKPGDTLVKIATRYGVTVAAIQQANNIANPNQIYPGQVLRIP